MRKFLYMIAALLVLIGISTNDVEARQDVYATTYLGNSCLLYTSPSPRDVEESRMPSSA